MNRKQRRSAGKAGRGAGASASSPLLIKKDVQKLLAAAKKQLEAGQPAETVALCDRALHKQPDLAPALKLKGVALDRMGRHDEGIELIRHAIRLKRNVAEFHNDLGIALANKGEIENAVIAFREAVRLRHDYAQAHCNLGLTLKMSGALDESVAASRMAIVHDPSLPEAYNNLAFALIEQGRPEEAVEACRKAISLRPEYANAHYNLAYTYEQWNRLTDAEAAAAVGLRVAPDHPGINLVAAICERRAGDPKKALDRLSRVSLAVASPVVCRAIHFELGQLHDRLGDASAAIAHFGTAKRMQSESWEARVVDKGVWQRKIDTLAERFTTTWVASWKRTADSATGKPPIFIVGFPRSGTTLLGQVFDSHPDLQTMVEKPTVANLAEAVANLPSGYPDALATLDRDELRRLRDTYFQSVGKHIERRPELTVVDEMPLNIVQVGLVNRIFPDARIVLALRHPCDVCLSCFMQNFMINEAMVNFFTIEDSAAFYARVMGLWRQYADVLPQDVHTLRYEDLVENFEAEVRRVLKFVGVDWESDVLNYAENVHGRMTIRTPSYSQVTEPIYTRAKYRWHRYRDTLAPVMETLAPFIDDFGYADR